MSEKYVITALPNAIILKDCGMNASTCPYLVYETRIGDTVYDARCIKPLPDPVQVEQSGWSVVNSTPRKSIAVVYCGLCGNEGVERS